MTWHDVCWHGEIEGHSPLLHYVRVVSCKETISSWEIPAYAHEENYNKGGMMRIDDEYD